MQVILRNYIAAKNFAIWAIIAILLIWGAVWIAQAGVLLFTTGSVPEAQSTNAAIGYFMIVAGGITLWAHLRK